MIAMRMTLARADVDAEILTAALEDLRRSPIVRSIATDNVMLIDGGDLVSPQLQRFELNPRR